MFISLRTKPDSCTYGTSTSVSLTCPKSIRFPQPNSVIVRLIATRYTLENSHYRLPLHSGVFIHIYTPIIQFQYPFISSILHFLVSHTYAPMKPVNYRLSLHCS